MNRWFCRPWLHRRRIGILQRGPNEKLVAMWEKYAATKRAPELPLSDKTVSELIKLAEDCYAEITRRSLLEINGPANPPHPPKIA